MGGQAGDYPEQDESKADISSLLEVNRLDYRLPPSLSIATSRSMRVYRAQQDVLECGRSSIQFTLASGSTYVDFLNSFLRFKVRFPTLANAADWATIAPKFSPHTGWAQLIRQVRVVHSGGIELDRTQESAGEFMQIQSYYNGSQQKRRTQGSLYSLNDSTRPSPIVNGNMLTDHAQTVREDVGSNATFVHNRSCQGLVVDVAIPLSEIMGIFNVDLLAPSFLTAGMQIHIDMYTPQHFFVCGTTANGEKHVTPPAASALPYGWPSSAPLLVETPEIHLETFTLTDAIVRKLSQISASGGLEWYFDAVHQMSGNPKGESFYSMSITRAMSRANNIIVKCRTQDCIGNSLEDSYGSQTWYKSAAEGGDDYVHNKGEDGTMNNFQVQLGAQYIPSRGLIDRKEYVHSALKTFSQFRRGDDIGGVDDTQFSGYRTQINSELVNPVAGANMATIVAAYDARRLLPDAGFKGLAISAVPLESSSTLQQSGAAISAQRTANVQMAWVNTSDRHRRVDAFVVYSKLVALYLDSVIVRS
jgi:hypothetical protein